MEQNLSKKTRTESDLIGSREVPESALYGVQTLRGIENFRISKFHLNEYSLLYFILEGYCRRRMRPVCSCRYIDGKAEGR